MPPKAKTGKKTAVAPTCKCVRVRMCACACACMQVYRPHLCTNGLIESESRGNWIQHTLKMQEKRYVTRKHLNQELLEGKAALRKRLNGRWGILDAILTPPLEL